MILMPIENWGTYKDTVITTKGLSLQYSVENNRYKIYAAENNIFVWCTELLKGSIDAIDFETNYMATANAAISTYVVTSLEKNDKDLKMAKLRADTDPATGIAVVQILCPGTPGVANEGRYIQGAEAFFKTAHP